VLEPLSAAISIANLLRNSVLHVVEWLWHGCSTPNVPSNAAHSTKQHRDVEAPAVDRASVRSVALPIAQDATSASRRTQLPKMS